jgi:hypothetical protein
LVGVKNGGAPRRLSPGMAVAIAGVVFVGLGVALLRLLPPLIALVIVGVGGIIIANYLWEFLYGNQERAP